MKTITKEIKIVAEIANKTGKYNSVLITKDHYMATNRFIIVAIERKGGISSDFPKVSENQDKIKDIESEKGVHVPASEILSLNFNKKPTIPIIEEMILKENEETVSFYSTNLKTCDKRTMVKASNKSLTHNSLDILEKETIFKVDITVSYLFKVLKAFSENGTNFATLKINSNNEIIIESCDQSSSKSLPIKGMIAETRKPQN